MLWNFLAFQLGWFACVFGGANSVPWFGVIVVIALSTLHASLVARPTEEFKLIGVAASIGLLWDSLLVSTGWLVYPSGTLVPGTAPVWIVALWANLATTLNVSLRWLKGRWLLAAIFGAAGGPLAYLAGAKLDGVSFADPVAAITALAVGWAALMPLLTVFAARFDGVGSGRTFGKMVPERA